MFLKSTISHPATSVDGMFNLLRRYGWPAIFPSPLPFSIYRRFDDTEALQTMSPAEQILFYLLSDLILRTGLSFASRYYYPEEEVKRSSSFQFAVIGTDIVDVLA